MVYIWYIYILYGICIWYIYMVYVYVIYIYMLTIYPLSMVKLYKTGFYTHVGRWEESMNLHTQSAIPSDDHKPYTLHTLFHTDRLAQRHRRHRLNHFLFVHGSRHPSGFGPGGVDVAGIPGFRCPHVLHVVRHKFHMISQDGDQSFLLHTHTQLITAP